MATPYDNVILATSGLVGYWPLSETAGTSATDLKNGNNGTLVNTPTKNVSLGFTYNDVGMTFATNQQVTIPNSANYQFGTGDYSLECWFFRSSDPSTEEFLINRGVAASGGNGFEMYLGDSGRYITSRMDTVYAQTAFPGWAWGGVWHHAVTAMDRDGYGKIYIDGVESDWPSGPTALSGVSSFNVSETATTYLGSNSSSGSFLNGGIAKVAFYNTALDATTVANHYAARLLSPTPSAGMLGFIGS